MQAYSDPSRESETYSLPDVEIFWGSPENGFDHEAGWYYWYCFPGCLPDSEPYGPFESEEAALKAMRDDNEA